MKKQLLIILFASYNLVFSQYILKNTEDVNWYKGITQERIVVNSNAALFFAGESMYFKVYCFNAETNQYSNNSKIAYVELVGKDNVVFKEKVRLVKGVGSGDFFIPANVKSGNYKLIGYTQWMKNGSKSNFYQTDIVVLNPFEENANADGSNSIQENLKNTSTTNATNKGLISIQTGAKSYKTRDKVSLNVNLLGNGFGNYAVFVRKKDQILSSKTPLTINTMSQNSKTVSETRSIGESIFLPEFTGEMITGKVINSQTGKPVAGKDVVLSVLSDEVFQDIVKTNTYGVFYFQLKEVYSKPDAIVQVLSKDRDNFTIEIKKHESIDYSSLIFKDFQLSNEYKNAIVERSIHNQIQNAYFGVKQDTLRVDSYPEPFFGNPPKVYELDDYKRFPTISETLVEIIDHVWDQKAENGKRRIDVREREFDPYYGIDLAPMVLVDGVFIQDHQSILDYDATKVKTIKVHREEYYYGKIVYQGILRIETFDSNYADDISGSYLQRFEMFNAKPAKGYFNQSYESTLNKSSRIPDFREQLLWHPNLEFNKRTMNLEFYTSDVTGDFEIILEGYTNLGELVYIQENITVN
jgi:hypothetical protein